jgi:hypothetical protein
LIAAWDKLRVEREALKVEQVAPPPGGRQPTDKGVRRTARELGMTRDAVSRSLKVAALSPEAKAKARAAGLANNQTALLKAAKHKEPEAQVAALETHAAM